MTEKPKTLFGLPIVEVEGMPDDTALVVGQPTGRYPVKVRQRFRYDPECERCQGTGISIVTDPATLTIATSTPCPCGVHDGFELVDVSNTIVIK